MDSAKIHPIINWPKPNTGCNNVVKNKINAASMVNFSFDFRYKILKTVPSPKANVLGAINELERALIHPKGIKKLSKENVFIFKISNINSRAALM